MSPSTNVHPSSTLHVRLLRKSRLGRLGNRRLLGEYRGLVFELLSEGTSIFIQYFDPHTSELTETGTKGKTVELTKPNDPKPGAIKLSFHLIINDSPPASLEELGLDAVTVSLADTRLALARLQAGTTALTVSNTVDTAISVESHAQSVTEGAKNLDSEQVIGILVATLDAVISVGDELATVCFSYWRWVPP